MARVKLDNYAIADAPRLGARGWIRWIWRQVTSMRVALILLLLLALASIPGSLLPQWPQDAAAARGFVEDNPFWGPLLDATGFLDVFGSAWFTAIYVLLFASLIGCIVPRIGVYWRELRAPVPTAPSRLDRYEPVAWPEPRGARIAIRDAEQELSPELSRPRGRHRPRWWRWLADYRVRVDVRPRQGDDADEELALSAHRGHVRELGNLLFHLALVGILLAMAAGSLLTFRGQAIIVEGRSFTNAVVAYDSFERGALVDAGALDPFTLRLDSFDAEFADDARPEHFAAHVTLTEPGGEDTATTIEVNRPLQVDGAKVYLQGNGYAPVITVRDGAGEVAFSGPVTFLPQDAVYTSQGVIKAPDVTSGPQLGFKATLYPSYLEGPFAAASVHPDPANPVILLLAYEGDLGLDEGVPQNVYRLDESRLSPVRGEDGQPVTLRLPLGETVDLPDGLGSVTFEELPRFVALDLRSDPSLPWLLAAAVLALVGLALSLFAPRRRIWVIAPLSPHAGRTTTVVSAAAWAPAHDAGVRVDLDRVRGIGTRLAREEP